MNRALSWVFLLALTSCGSSTTGGAPDEGQRALTASSEASTGEAAPSAAPSASAAATASVATAPPIDPVSARLSLPAGALFAYREGNVTLSFTSPNHLTLLVPSDKPCTYDLGDHGNMVSGKEVEAAWKNAEAQKAVASSSVFLSPDDPLVSGAVVGAAGRIEWTAHCGGLCPKGPPGVTGLLQVLHVLAVNVRGVCKV